MVIEKVIKSLLKNKIEFLVIGSFAKLWNRIGVTYPRDLDIWIKSSLENRIFLREEFGVDLSIDCIGEIRERAISINLFVGVDGLVFDDANKNAKIKKLKDGTELRYISSEDYFMNINKTREKWDF